MPGARGCAGSWSTARPSSPSRAGESSIRSRARWPSCCASAASACTQAVDRALQRPPLTEPAALLAPVDEQEVWASGVTYRRSATARVEESSVGDVYELVYEAQRPELFLKAPAVARGGARRAAAHPRRLDLGRPRARARARHRRPGARSSATSRPTTSRRARSRAPTRSTCRRPRSTTTRSACRARSSWPATRPTRARRRSSSRSTATASALFAGETSVSEMKRGFDELVAALYLELSFPAGAVLLTGTGVVPARRVHARRTATACGSPSRASGVLEHDIYRRETP